MIMKKQTIAIDTPYVRPDAYGSLAVPIYNNVAFDILITIVSPTINATVTQNTIASITLKVSAILPK